MAELPGIERETLDVDVVIVGAGPAGLAAAYQLAKLVAAHNASSAEKKLEGLSIAVLEKGKEIGSHGLSGAVMDPKGIAELMPDWLERECPIEAPVGDDGFWYLTENMKIAAPILPPPLQNHGNYVISLGEMVRWMSGIVGEVGVDRFAAGTVIHTMGWPLDMDTFGGAFIYGMKERIVDVGLVVGLDYKNPTLDPHHEFQRLKLHPSIRKILEGGKMIAAGAKAIPEGGYFSMPRPYGDGFMILGDSAGFLNGARLKGIHLAIKSGMLAADTAFHALLNEDYSSQQLSEYEA